VSQIDFIQDMMKVVGVKTSKTDQDLTVEMLDRVTKKVYGDDTEAARGFITLVAIESRFDNKAKSHAGAVGLAQIVTKYAQDFAKHCNMEISDSDVATPEINLMLGACLFRSLKQEYGNTSMALVGYNAGKFSTQLKQLKAQSNITNIETVNYVTRFHYLQELVKK
jgi:soluble lytic murein transglycosylase